MMKPMLFAAVFTATAAATDHKLFINVDDVCAERTADNVPVCMATLTYDKKTCWKMFGSKEARCYIPACYKQGEEPTELPRCITYTTGAVSAANIVSAASLGTSGTRHSLAAQALTNLPDSNGMRWGWPDIPKSAFLNFPTSLVGRLGQVPNVFLGQGFKLGFDCPAGYSGEGNKCDLFAFIYRCPPCTFSNGDNFVVDLLADGWEPYSCDVKFQLDQTVPTHEHGVIVYHKQIDEHGVRDTGYTIAPKGLLELSWFATSPATAHCSGYDEAMCATELPDECQWDSVAQTCNRVLCPARSQGPDRVHRPGPGGNPHTPKGPWVQQCKVCVDDERDMYMPTYDPNFMSR
eukprot:TRINITY_DN57_c1_g1_i3.p1 TRINITY_DN57_c1_g1~~TRINITY_DN57_c1_g1_i3.p1  ORF type:complete len:364 (+),score=103.21 TRINITY_DN57_c1_g1_i3:49-1092(+)